jgi:hypothetical protein
MEQADFGGVLRFGSEVVQEAKQATSRTGLVQQAAISNKLFLASKGAKVNDIGVETRDFKEQSAKSIT